jgi:hypothetical protein
VALNDGTIAHNPQRGSIVEHDYRTAANISGYSPVKSRNRPRRRRYKLSYASPEQPAIICMKFEGDRRPVYDMIDRTAREGDISRQNVIFNALAAFFTEEKKE